MVTEQQQKEFIKEIAPLAQYAYKTLGKVKPSVCIGMACIESGFGYGTDGSRLMYKHNAVLGQKVGTGKTATKYWDKTFFTSKTKEEYTIGKHTIIQAAFRSYKNLQQCILNYYELLNTRLYARVKSYMDFESQMKAIKACGYMTSSTEVNSVLTTIRNFNLTQYDFVDDNSVERNPYKPPTGTLKLGVKNEGVKWLQFELNKYGYSLAVDGTFGRITRNAVIDYQREHGLVADGIVGQKTLAKLLL
mgnify:CR=1 FL=1